MVTCKIWWLLVYCGRLVPSRCIRYTRWPVAAEPIGWTSDRVTALCIIYLYQKLHNMQYYIMHMTVWTIVRTRFRWYTLDQTGRFLSQNEPWILWHLGNNPSRIWRWDTWFEPTNWNNPRLPNILCGWFFLDTLSTVRARMLEAVCKC